jgi:hypothetical protein
MNYNIVRLGEPPPITYWSKDSPHSEDYEKIIAKKVISAISEEAESWRKRISPWGGLLVIEVDLRRIDPVKIRAIADTIEAEEPQTFTIDEALL